jgi:aminopeptidase N
MRSPILSRAARTVPILLAGITGALFAQHPPNASGGPLLGEQASYDVRFYDLSIAVRPSDSSIGGTLTIHADVVHPMDWLVLDLDTTFTVGSTRLIGFGGEWPLEFERRGGRIWIALPPATRQPGQDITVTVAYEGRPRAVPPRGFGGFLWTETPSGDPWIAVSCETFGADLWWPVKDHLSDEPDSLALNITVPEPLVVATNGKLRDVTQHANGTRTYHWFVSTPINNYGVSLNIAPYEELTTPYESVDGETHTVHFWVLPENVDKARAALPGFLDHMRHFEEMLGPYPFWEDKYGIAEVPYLGMEHQTIIAYGANYRFDAMARIDWGFDGLHQHELAHEWFGNQVTPPDFKDLWLNEAFAQYSQPLYAESRLGKEKAQEIQAIHRSRIRNDLPLAAREPRTARQAYAASIYYKGAWVLQSLRYLMGDEAFFELLRRWTYPESPAVATTGSCRCRFATTDEFVRLASGIANEDLRWFFEVYVRQPALPRLVVEREGERLSLSWDVPNGLPFPMPVDVSVDGRIGRVLMPGARTTITVPAAATVEVDPENWILMEEEDEQ